MPGVDVWRYMGFGGVTRDSWGDETCWGVPMALCIGRAPFAACEKAGDGPRECTCWGGGAGDDMTCWLRPEGVRDGIWRLVRLPGERSRDGDNAAGGGAGWGVGVPAGESDGDSSELMSMAAAAAAAAWGWLAAMRCDQSVPRTRAALPSMRWACGSRVLFLPSRAAGTRRHRIPRSERHGTSTEGRRAEQGRMRRARAAAAGGEGRGECEGEGEGERARARARGRAGVSSTASWVRRPATVWSNRRKGA